MRRRLRRRGVTQAVQLLLVLPILLIVLFGAVQFGAYFMQQQRLQAAVDVAAQIAAAEHDSDALRKAAAEEAFASALTGVGWQKSVTLELDLAHVSGEAVKVTAIVPLKAVIPDVLAWAGLGLGNQTMDAQAVLKKS
jgi:Flp pilus assembly protein TadG